MAQFKGNYLADAALNWYLGTTYPAAPAGIWVALMTVAPTSRAGTGGTEVTGGSYARVQILAAGWGAVGTSGSGITSIEQILQSANVNFPTATANWGTVVGVALYDASSGGHFLEYGDLSSSQAVNNGSTFQIPANDVVIQEK